MRQGALWDVEEQAAMPAVRDTIIAPVAASDVHEFGHRYHYTGTGGAPLWRWGLWHGPVLLGVIAYNLPTRSACESVFGPEHHQHVWHMSRLSLADHALPNSESRLIGGSLRAIGREHPEVWAVLTYAATNAGHIGYVYQATNALYTGPTEDKHASYLDKDGNMHSDYDGSYISAHRADELGWVGLSSRKDSPPKHRYVYILGSKTQRRHRLSLLRLPILSYPKASDLQSV